jgi:hypothetical protein
MPGPSCDTITTIYTLSRTLAAVPTTGGRIDAANDINRSYADPLMTLQWLQVRVKPDHCREIRPRAHRPPWDDAGAEA